MTRDALTQKLVRILEALDREKFILKVKRLYVFGSYARGASEPGDLDLLLVYEFPDDHSKRVERFAEKAPGSVMDRIYAVHREYMNDLKGRLCKRGEKIDLLVKTPSEFEHYVAPDGLVKPDDLVLLWSEKDRNWKHVVFLNNQNRMDISSVILRRYRKCRGITM